MVYVDLYLYTSKNTTFFGCVIRQYLHSYFLVLYPTILYIL